MAAGTDFANSALATLPATGTDAVRHWLQARRQAHRFAVSRIPFTQLQRWQFDPLTGNLVHDSGRFFSIEGMAVDCGDRHWQQPIIHQPEVGILGILSRRIDGIRHFLMQAKMEPGNIGTLQLSPTVQATHSNFSGVHAGKRPPYLNHFLQPDPARVLLDGLQAEQGARFWQKKNRNLIIDTDAPIDVLDDFRWMTLAEIKALLQDDNRVNMDARSILGCIDYGHPPERTDASPLLHSLQGGGQPLHSDAAVGAWLAEQRQHCPMRSRRIPLAGIADWVREADRLHHARQPYFSVIAVAVEASSREVDHWTQPMLSDPEPGLIGFVSSRINGCLHVLVQAKAEGGSTERVEIAPTVSCAHYRHHRQQGTPIPFLDLLADPPAASLRYRALQSEEGGRFYRVQNLNTLIEIDDHRQLPLPPAYRWLSLAQLVRLIRAGQASIDARTLLSCLPLQIA